MSSGGNLDRVLVAVDGSEESMNALRWAFTNLKLRSPAPDSTDVPSYIILHVQSPPSIATGLNPGSIPFGGPSGIEVPAFTAAIEAHQKRITHAVLNHASGISSQFNLTSKVRTHVVVGDPKEKICEAVEDLNADVLVMGSRAFGPIKSRYHKNDLINNMNDCSLYENDVPGKCKQLLCPQCSVPSHYYQGKGQLTNALLLCYHDS
ncbi:hypothetical protein CR513_53319 [Mucuna pruriens]|uniref:UspA domain-containing protein n=1 Tax=Mucuna pruriens TaxID=157652 RepID=A0A371ENY6_MUCPR|nr:hypothetical protein CR513_53319 [Mucuna pruriens]